MPRRATQVVLSEKEQEGVPVATGQKPTLSFED